LPITHNTVSTQKVTLLDVFVVLATHEHEKALKTYELEQFYLAQTAVGEVLF